MKIQSRIVLALVPLFAALSVVTSALTYYLQMKEIDWGLKEEATSIAVSAARFAAGQKPGDAMQFGHLNKILAMGRARRFSVFPLPEGKALFDAGAADSAQDKLKPAADVIAALADAPCTAGTVQRSASGLDVLVAWAPVRNSEGKPEAILAVETDASVARSLQGDILRTSMASFAGALALGLLISLIIVKTITRKIASLTLAVERVEGGRYDEAPVTGIIEELNDLGNTFDTMRSVLKEVVARRWRNMIEAEQFRSEDDLMCAFKNRYMPPVLETRCGVSVGGELLGCRPLGSFFGIWEISGTCFAVAGKVAASGVMEQTTTASGALSLIRREIEQAQGRLPPALVTKLFTLKQCRIVTWKNAADLTVWSYREDKGDWAKTEMKLKPGAAVFFHTLEAGAGDRIESYARHFPAMPMKNFLDELQVVVDDKGGGALLMLRTD